MMEINVFYACLASETIWVAKASPFFAVPVAFKCYSRTLTGLPEFSDLNVTFLSASSRPSVQRFASPGTRRSTVTLRCPFHSL